MMAILIAGVLLLVPARVTASAALVSVPSGDAAPVDQENRDTLTPLMRAAARGDIEAVNQLLAEGADVNAQTAEYRLTPLIFASYFGRMEVATLLVAKGARIALTDAAGAGPVDWAVVGERHEMAKMWTDRGASLNPFLNVGVLPIAFVERAAVAPK